MSVAAGLAAAAAIGNPNAARAKRIVRRINLSKILTRSSGSRAFKAWAHGDHWPPGIRERFAVYEAAKTGEFLGRVVMTPRACPRR